MEDWGADAVLVFGWNYDSHLKCIKHFKGKIPVLFRGDSTLLDERSGLRRTARRMWLRYVYRHVDIGFYVGQNNKAYYLKHGLKEDQLVYAPHAIDNERFFDPTGAYKKEAGKLRKEVGISEDETVCLFVGKFEQKKDPEIFVRVAEQFPELKFVLVGNGVLEDTLKSKSGKNVRYIDFQNQSRMPVIYRLGDLLILPSKGPGETWGLAVNEAMACGLPVLVSDKTGCGPDLVDHNQNGFIFDSGNADVLAEKIKAITFDKTVLKTFGERSSEIIKSFNFETVSEAIERTLLYE
jgi:glycosyltransferase involved in cell wall biosynthesis